MEQRKTPQADLSKKRGLFLHIGLALSLVLVISAFEWKFYDDLSTIDLGSLENEFEPLVDIPPIIEQTPPPPQVVQDPIIKVVQDDEQEDPIDLLQINTDATKENITVTNFPPVPETVIKEETEEEPPFEFVEQMPEPKDGIKEFYKYLGKEIQYPKTARRLGIQGKVFVQFVVDKDGTLTEIKVLKGIGGGCDEEALRVIQKAPKWKPGKQRGRAVRVRMSIPINFQLN